MKIKLLWILFLSVLSCSVWASNYPTFTLLNNSVQATFPSLPKEYDLSGYQKYVPGLRMFAAGDVPNKAVYILRYREFEQDKDVGAYNQKIKGMLDWSLKKSFEASGGILDEFTSIFDRKRNIYKAEFSGRYLEEGIWRYKSAIQIIYKRRVYDWSVMYPDKSLKWEYFDKYKSEFKVFK
ncbi:hypothetical protein [Hydrogenovibrio marinus]|uniref:Lipoprotein n=1 Tax=Hydrogenovibrio marinus TaxID=28885 RepID=A0A066ZSP4_HYDMR|nr:hypothetical protein [Hydrogenovibrio marinus]KDN96517.1 hypothetical protein EI16_09665 [Hydrogenovibrio marinus]BBN60281.1 hypothetical protein HVMH_1875 [Hydrogenovibrio marinus]